MTFTIKLAATAIAKANQINLYYAYLKVTFLFLIGQIELVTFRRKNGAFDARFAYYPIADFYIFKGGRSIPTTKKFIDLVKLLEGDPRPMRSYIITNKI